MTAIDTLDEAVGRLEQAETTLESLQAAQDLVVLATRIRTTLVRAALAEHSYAAVGRVLNISRQGVRDAYPRTAAAAGAPAA